MNKVYLDNAATTQIREEVIREMVQVMSNDFGNPSSTHSFGRNAKNIIEIAINLIFNCLELLVSNLTLLMRFMFTIPMANRQMVNKASHECLSVGKAARTGIAGISLNSNTNGEI